MKRLLPIIFILLSYSVAQADIDITLLPALGVPATATDGMLTYDSGQPAGSRATKADFNNNAGTCWSGVGTWIDVWTEAENTAANYGTGDMLKSVYDIGDNGVVDQAEALSANGVDAITEIAAALKSGLDTTLITGTAGINGNCVQWNGDGDIVDSGGTCGGGATAFSGITSGTNTTAAMIVGSGATITASGTGVIYSTSTLITDNESTDECNPIVFVPNADPDGGQLALESDGDLCYNPSTGTLSSTILSAAPSATPTSKQFDSDTVDGDPSTQEVTNCTNTGSGTENCDKTFSQQIGGVMTAYMNVDADGNIGFNNRTLDTGTWNGSLGSGTVDDDDLNTTDQITVLIDGGGSAISTGTKMYVPVEWAGTITQSTLLCDQSTTTTIDVWKDTYANYPPTDADSITASAVPGTSAALKDQDGTLTGWTTAITAGDILGFNVDANDNATFCTLSLKVTR